MRPGAVFIRILAAIAAQTGVCWLGMHYGHYADAVAAAVLAALAANLFFNLPLVSLFSLVVHHDRASATFREIVGRAATLILFSAFAQLPIVFMVGRSATPEVIGGTLFLTSLLPVFVQGAITVVRGVSIAAGRTHVQ